MQPKGRGTTRFGRAQIVEGVSRSEPPGAGPEQREEPGLSATSRRSLEVLHVFLALVDRVLGTVGDLTISQLRALAILAEEGGMRSIDLAVALGLDPSTVSRLCTRLESRGLVSLGRSRESRREIQIELTDAGWALLQEIVTEGLRDLRRYGGDDVLHA